ncbi:MICOS complex subunit MIC60 [Strongylocentrotus purpuratus]|uniref:MICOS complex subunit MIC60 n=1 Tax=Strongylocentrotus purpuratus TaxID=7668 RepID=A0A7M7NYJ6_STRPU|nr:MICOS complex subunit MIC60 [Strongylocentrotus purpuratus]
MVRGCLPGQGKSTISLLYQGKMWRLSGNISRTIRACTCRTPNPVSHKAGGKCSYCSKPSSTPPEAPKSAPPPPPPPPPPPRVQKKSGSAGKVIMGGLLVGVGATVGTLAYAKANPEFRKQVEGNWPMLLDVFPYFLDEDAAGDTKKSKADSMSLGGGKKPLIPISSPNTVTPTGETHAVISQSPSVQATREPAVQPKARVAPKASLELEATLKKEEEARRSQELHEKLLEQEIDEAASLAAYEAIVESCVSDSVEATRIAMGSKKEAVEATKQHTDKLKLAMGDLEEENGELKKKQWDEVVVAAENKLKAVTQASKGEAAAREALAKLKAVLEEANRTKTSAGQSSNLIGAQANLNQMVYDLEFATAEVVVAQNEARILKNYHELIQEGRESFKKEVQSLMPEAKIGKKGKKLTEEELNALIAHAHRRVYQLQKGLAEQQAMEQKRLAAAMEVQKEEDEGVTKSKVMVELERQAADLAVLYQRKQEDLLAEAEQELRLQLRRQAAAHSDHLSDVLQQQRQEFDRQLSVQDVLVRDQERDNYYKQLSGAMAKLRGVEAAVEGRAGLEVQNQKAQELWLACETLKRTIATGKLEASSWEEKLKPLASEVQAIKEASVSNDFVDTVVKTIPEEALTRGVFTEDSLRQRWDQTQRVCKRVAMIDETSSGMFAYFLSYFQSLLLLNDPLPPNSEEAIDLSTLDTFKLVSYASYHMENGNLEQALRYANQLTGMPRKVASDWLREARLLLETSQAASVLSSHASASGLGGLHFQ